MILFTEIRAATLLAMEGILNPNFIGLFLGISMG
jgi:hypothetical protein